MKRVNRPVFGGSRTTTVAVLAFVQLLGALAFLVRCDCKAGQRESTNSLLLGGHSTGGTLALLVAESTDRFRAIFSFGPVEDASGYGSKYLPFDVSNRKEVDLRAPIKWLQAIRNPTFVFEGTEQRSNIDSVMALSRTSRNPLVHFHPVKGANHFSILAPVSRLVASKILRDDGVSSNIKFTENGSTGALHK
jgi:predicted alpha/beta-hydrolase family hydrolase